MNTNNINLAIKKILGEPVKRLLIRLLFPARNSFLLFNWSQRAAKHRVNLNYWNESPNLGDALSPVIVEHMLAQRGLSMNTPVDSRKHLYAVGSVLTAGIQDATVWGSGVLNSALTYRLKNRRLDVRAVRGPITRAILMDYGYAAPPVYGDPAILMPEIYQPKPTSRKVKYGLILHKDYDFSHENAGKAFSGEILKLDIRTTDFRQFIDQLTSVERVISSSLHGIILAEAYGTPAVLLKPQVDIIKYYDYYYSTCRFDFPIAATLEDAMDMQPAPLPELDELKAGLRAAFPYDLYK